MKKPNPLLEDLKPLLPTIAANATRAEQMRQVPDENIALLRSIGLHRAFQPKAFGGLELSLPEFADCIASLAGSCASTAWAMSLLCTHSHQLALFSAELQQEIWGENPDATASSSIAPFGRVVEGEGVCISAAKWAGAAAVTMVNGRLSAAVGRTPKAPRIIVLPCCLAATTRSVMTGSPPV